MRRRFFPTSKLQRVATVAAALVLLTISANAQTAHDPSKADALPAINVYVPEGAFSLRMRRLIRNVLFEAQVNYRFINGSISTFLRYEYYASSFTYKLGIFDSIDFPDVSRQSLDFTRTRGGLILFKYPVDYNRRWFTLVESDALSFADVTKSDNDRTNNFVKLGYQFGTTFDPRLNAIVGEARGRITPVLTVYRDLGSQKVSFAAAITKGGEFAGGSYDYAKAEGEALRRFDLPRSSLMITRAHVATVIQQSFAGLDEEGRRSYTVPRYEMFKLGGREALRGADSNVRGLHELHLTNEFFFPILRNASVRRFGVTWRDLYGIVYTGSGAVGDEYAALARTSNYVADGGLGCEASTLVRGQEILIGALYARAMFGPDELKGGRLLVFARTPLGRP